MNILTVNYTPPYTTTYLESPTLYCLFTLQLSGGCGDNKG